MNSIPSMNFFTTERMVEFWGYVKSLLTSMSPMVMIFFAIIAVGVLLTIIISAIRQAKEKDEEEHEEYEIRHY